MANTWQSPHDPSPHSVTAGGIVRAVLRGVPLFILVFGGLCLLLLIRLIEWPLYGAHRPVTPYITQNVCRAAFFILGIDHQVQGAPMKGPGAVVANHSSWLDIFALNARKRVYFVAKAEVAGWPGIGLLARATGTVFIKREKKAASAQVKVFRQRLRVRHKLLFFPEGTSTDGQQVLPFKSTLFAAFFDPALQGLNIQPVTLHYIAPKGQDARFYGWWGDMGFGSHFFTTLAAQKQGAVQVIYHAPVALRDFKNRKDLAKTLENTIRGGLPVKTKKADHKGPAFLRCISNLTVVFNVQLCPCSSFCWCCDWTVI